MFVKTGQTFLEICDGYRDHRVSKGGSANKTGELTFENVPTVAREHLGRCENRPGTLYASNDFPSLLSSRTA